MPRCIIRPRAARDLRDITLHIEADSPGRGISYVKEIEAVLALYAGRPHMGRERPEISDGLRSFPFGNYVVFYRPTADGIAVIRVLHGARDLRFHF